MESSVVFSMIGSIRPSRSTVPMEQHTNFSWPHRSRRALEINDAADLELDSVRRCGK